MEVCKILDDCQEQFSIGSSPSRKEDVRFLVGKGEYIADTVIDGETRCVFVRSTIAHAKISIIDIDAAKNMDGVHAVYTGKHVETEKLSGIPWEVRPPTSSPVSRKIPPLGDPTIAAPQALMARDRVRYVGEIVAMVIAKDLEAARDAAEFIKVTYDEMPASVSIEDAISPSAELIWRDFPNNVAFNMKRGDVDKTEKAFATAHHISTLRVINQRILGNPIETRGAIAYYDADTAKYTLHTPAGKPHPIRNTLADYILKVPRQKIRVLTGDIGGGFGAKNVLYPEQCLVLWAATKIGFPVKWIQDRIEAAQSDMQARDQSQLVELALDKEHRFTGLRVRAKGNLGAYMAPRGANPPTLHRLILPSVYHIPTMDLEVEGIYSNTAPTCSIRGAGAPEAIFMLERVIDTAAYELGVNPIELRKLNAIPRKSLPYKTAFQLEYDTGQFGENMDAALRLINWEGFPLRRKTAKKNGMLRGFALANLLEVHGSGISEMAEITIDESGHSTVYIGTQSSGQGHATVYAQIVAGVLCSSVDNVTVIQGDTDLISEGNGTGASRSIIVGGSALLRAANKIIESAKTIASYILEAASEDIEFDKGAFRVSGTDRTITFAEVAAAAHNQNLSPKEMTKGLHEIDRYEPENPTFPNGCHTCEVEIDPDTGKVEIIAYAMVQDSGVLVNPVIVQGQIHGGAAFGIGQSLMEDARCNALTGQVERATFLDYAMPRADDMPSFGYQTIDLPCKNNPLGVKACGESGTVGPPPAVIGAIVDALQDFGIRHIEMPATPEVVWRAIQTASAGH